MIPPLRRYHSAAGGDCDDEGREALMIGPAHAAGSALRLGLVVLALAALGGVDAHGARAANDPTTSTTLTVSPGTALPGQPIVLTATVHGTTSPVGTIVFASEPADGSAGFTVLGTVPLTGVPGSLTDSSAQLTLTMAPGSYLIRATFNSGDIAYNRSVSLLVPLVVSSSQVHNTTTVLTATPDTLDAGQIETLTATVTTNDGSGIVPTGTVTFRDNGQLLGDAPLVDGVATFEEGGFGPGHHELTASYTGTTFVSGGVTVELAPSEDTIGREGPNPPQPTHTVITVDVSPTAIHTGDFVDIQAHVTQEGGVLLPSGATHTVTFYVAGSATPFGTAELDPVTGVATLVHVGNWQVPTNGSTVTIVASYAGDSFLNIVGGSATADLTVVPPAVAATLTLGGDVSADFNDGATLTATLLDAGGNPLSGKTVDFTLGAETCSAETDELGVATCHVGVTDASATNATASFAGDLSADPADATAPFAVLPEETTLTASIAGGTSMTTLSAVLLEDGTTPIAGRTIAFTLGGEPCTGTTDATGLATCQVPSLTGLTSALLTASFAGDAAYATAGFSQVVPLQIPTHFVSVGSTPVDYHDSATLSATLLDIGAAPVDGQHVTLSLGSQSCPATTTATGLASCTIASVTGPPGATTVTAAFAGQGLYLPSSASTPFTIAKEQTTAAIATSGPILSGATISLSGSLLEDGVTPVAGVPLTLSLGTLSCTVQTDAAGVATCTVPGTTPLGPTTTKASFAGNEFYLASASSSTSALLFAFAPGGGAFVVGDRSAAGAVTFWGSQWAKTNSLSGGSAPSAFKGFALKVPSPARCGSTWTTDPGNSSPPPAAPLPAYMGVIVTSSTGKSGPAISGNIAHIVVVKTNPGYGPNPGHAGTGTVVATVC